MNILKPGLHAYLIFILNDFNFYFSNTRWGVCVCEGGDWGGGGRGRETVCQHVCVQYYMCIHVCVCAHVKRQWSSMCVYNTRQYPLLAPSVCCPQKV